MNPLKLGAAELDRMPAIPDAQMTAEQKKVMDEIAAGPRGRIGGPFIPLMRSPELMNRIQKVGEYLRFHNTVGLRNSEFAELIVARHWSQPIEWAIHRPIAEKEGVLPATCDAIGRPPPRQHDRRRDADIQRARRASQQPQHERSHLCPTSEAIWRARGD